MSYEELYQQFIGYGCSKYQSARRAKLVHNWDGKSELSQGMIYNELRKIGINQLISFEIETKYWILYDKIIPPTPWERGMTSFVEGTSKLKYNQIPLI